MNNTFDQTWAIHRKHPSSWTDGCREVHKRMCYPSFWPVKISQLKQCKSCIFEHTAKQHRSPYLHQTKPWASKCKRALDTSPYFLKYKAKHPPGCIIHHQNFTQSLQNIQAAQHIFKAYKVNKVHKLLNTSSKYIKYTKSTKYTNCRTHHLSWFLNPSLTDLCGHSTGRMIMWSKCTKYF